MEWFGWDNEGSSTTESLIRVVGAGQALGPTSDLQKHLSLNAPAPENGVQAAAPET